MLIISLTLVKGYEKNNLQESWENYDSPGFTYIDNNFNDSAQLPYDAHCHIMTPSEVIYLLVKNDRRTSSN